MCFVSLSRLFDSQINAIKQNGFVPLFNSYYRLTYFTESSSEPELESSLDPEHLPFLSSLTLMMQRNIYYKILLPTLDDTYSFTIHQNTVNCKNILKYILIVNFTYM